MTSKVLHRDWRRRVSRPLTLLVVIPGLLGTSAGCRRSSERISAEDAGVVSVPSSTAPAPAPSPLDEALKLGPIDLSGSEAENFWEGMVSTQKQDRWVEATLVRRVPGGYVSRLQGAFAPGRTIEHEAKAWLVHSSDELDAFLGSRIMCKVRLVDAQHGAVVLAGDAAHERMRRAKLARLVPGTKLTGRVTIAAEYGVFVELDDVSDDLWLSSAMMHATAYGRNGAPKPGARVTVTVDKPWTPADDGRLFFVKPL